MTLQPIKTDGAPAAIGPYNQAIVVENSVGRNAAAGDLVFCSGQVALDPVTGEMVGATAAEQAERALRNLRAVVEDGPDVDAVPVVELGEFGAHYPEFHRLKKSIRNPPQPRLNGPPIHAQGLEASVEEHLHQTSARDGGDPRI